MKQISIVVMSLVMLGMAMFASDTIARQNAQQASDIEQVNAATASKGGGSGKPR